MTLVGVTGVSATMMMTTPTAATPTRDVEGNDTRADNALWQCKARKKKGTNVQAATGPLIQGMPAALGLMGKRPVLLHPAS